MAGLLEYTFAVKDKENLQIVNEVIKAFQYEVVPKYNKITEGKTCRHKTSFVIPHHPLHIICIFYLFCRNGKL